MFYVRYVFAELARRRGRTVLTALGIGVGVALVVAISALTTGLSNAQEQVLKPLTGVGTDMSVTRPLNVKASGNGSPFGGLSSSEQKALQKENGGARVGFGNLGEVGSKFHRENFTTTQLSFSSATAEKIGKLSGTAQVAGGLTLSALDVSGTVPEQSTRQAGPGGFGGGAPGGGAGGAPSSIKIDSRSVSGVDQKHPQLGAVTRSQVSKGKYFSTGEQREAILSLSYAKRQGLTVGESITLKSKTYKVVGLASPPLGGSAADVYVKLSQLQEASDRESRVNTVYVRARSTDDVAALSREIKKLVPGAAVTTTQDLADRVGGSLVDAKNLASKLGTALAIVALLASVLIAMLLTLSSVAKRTRELGTLKAIGWRQSQVVRQVSAESLVQGAFGGVIGAILGVAAAAVVSAAGFTLKASVAGATTQAGPFGGGGPGGGGGFGQGQIVSGATEVALKAPVGFDLVLLAIGLSLLAGLIAGAVGGLRVARLRPAEALRTIG